MSPEAAREEDEVDTKTFFGCGYEPGMALGEVTNEAETNPMFCFFFVPVNPRVSPAKKLFQPGK